MVDIDRLNEKISSSGYRRGFLAKQLGLGTTAFYNKTHGVTDFLTEEALKLSKLLGIKKSEMVDIFFAVNSDK